MEASGVEQPPGVGERPGAGERPEVGEPEAPRPFGVYVHIPFCERRCDYCDFATWTDREHLVEEYVDACVAEVEARYRDGAHPPASSVFFGGGTPSLLEAGLLVRILDAVPRAPDAEVTVECNPDSVDEEKLRTYRRHGVDRISLGVQSLAEHVLRALGRSHDPDNVARAVDAIRAVGFDSFNVDLVYGAAGESVADWRATVEGVLALGAPHVSAYGLTVEPGTPLERRIEAGETAAPRDDDQADKYAIADELLTGAGLEWYEISNWAAPGHECDHNRLYWGAGDYLGVGCAAHGATGGRRWWNVRTPERYVAAIGRGELPEAAGERLDGAAAADEALMLELRTREGVAATPRLEARAEELVASGLLERSDGRLVLTRAGRLLATEVTLALSGP